MKKIAAACFAALLSLASSFALAQGGPGGGGGGPGPPPDPWTVNGSAISYGGCVLLPAAVIGGCKGNGTINASGIFVNGVAVGGVVNVGLINQVAWYAAGGTTLSGLATANNGVLVTSAGGVPSISSTLPAAVQANITGTGTLTSGATGAGFTIALSASTITGTLPDGNLSSNVPLKNAANVFTAQQIDQGATTTSPGWYAQVAGDTVPRVRVGLNAADIPSIAFGPGNGNRDAFVERVGPGALRFGAPDAATAVAQTISVQNVVAGTSNVAGANFTISGSQGTGTGIGGSLIFQVAPAGSTGSTQNALITALTIDSTKLATFAGSAQINGGLTVTTVAVGGCTIGSNTFCAGNAGAGPSMFGGPTSVVGAAFGLSGNISAAAWTTNGVRYKNVAATLTDTSSSGTVATAYTDSWGGNTIAASSATTFTNYFGSYFAVPVVGTNVTFTNAWAIGADSAKFGTSNQVTITSAGAMTVPGTLNSGTFTITSSSASAFAVGLNGATNPAFAVDASTALQVAGLKLTGAVTGGTVALVATDSGSNANLTINAKGTGTIGIGSVSTGIVTITPQLNLGNVLTYGTGLGAINQLQGPTDQPFSQVANAPAVAASTVAGNAFNITASNATAGNTNAGSGAGGAVAITAGNAARFTSGNAAGGAVSLIGGTSIGTGAGGAINLTGGTPSGTSSSAGGAVVILAGSGSSTPANASVAGGAVSMTAGASAYSNQAGTTPPAGGTASLVSGLGGNNTAAAGTAGAGGTLSVTSGVGGVASAATGGIGGASGALTISTGAGGNASGGSGTRNGGNSGVITISTGAVGTGASANGTAGTIQFAIGGSNIANFGSAGHLLWNTDNTYDIGATGATRPRNLYIAGTANIGGATTITSASASALTVGLNGATNPAFQVDASTASQAAGIKITGAATGGTVSIVAIDSGSSTNLNINGKGAGIVTIADVSTGGVNLVGGVQVGGFAMTFPGAAATIPQVVASGTLALSTGAISSVTCVDNTATATGALTTDALEITFASDPTGVTGYAPSTGGSLWMAPWFAAGVLHVKQCNPSSGSITPGALSLNWKLVR